MDHGLTRDNALRAPVAKVKQRGVTQTRRTPGSWSSVALSPVSCALWPWSPGSVRVQVAGGRSVFGSDRTC